MSAFVAQEFLVHEQAVEEGIDVAITHPG